MSIMGTNTEVFRKILHGAGAAAVVIGIFTIGYAFVVGSRMASLTQELGRNLTIADDGLSLLEGNAGLVEASFGVLDQMGATMRQSATALRSAAVVLDEVGSPTGLVIPGESLDESASDLHGAADQVDLLATRIEEIREEGSVGDIAPAWAVVADLRTQLGGTEQALSRAGFAQGAVGFTILLGGLYILLGGLAMALAGLIDRIDRLARSAAVQV